MAYTAPTTVVAGQTYSAAAHNVIVNDIIDHEDRLDTVQNAQYPARNVLVNGAMQFAQRGTSVSGITTSGSPQTADRWNVAISSGGTWTCAVSADAPTGSGFRNSLRMTCSASGAVSAAGYVFVGQKLEGQTLQHIKKGTASAQQLTLSFWVKGSTTGTYICQLYDNDNARSVSGSYTISAADTWEQKTITFPADTTGAFDNDNASSLEFQMYLSAGTDRTSGTLATVWGSSVSANNAVGQTNLSAAASRYLAITGVQLEPGSQASPFEFVRYDDELRRCQRYYYVIANSADVATSAIGIGTSTQATAVEAIVHLPVTMRATPVISATSGTGIYTYFRAGAADVFNNLSLGGITTNKIVDLVNTTEISGTAGQSGVVHITSGSSAVVAVSAEL